MAKHILNIYNTLTGKYEDVEVSEEVFNTYRRSYWNEKYHNRVEEANTIILSTLTYSNSDGEESIVNTLTDGTPSVEDSTMQKETLSEVIAATRELSTVMQRRFFMRYVQGLTNREIAIIEKTTVQAIKQSLRLAREKIRKRTVAI